MIELSIRTGDEVRQAAGAAGELLGRAILAAGLSLEQPCAGRGTCGKCKVLAEGGLGPLDEVETRFLLPAERAAGLRLACRARLAGPARITLTPRAVYSNKIFNRSTAYRTSDDALGLAVDLGSTTVAALLVSLRSGEVYAGAAALNQQTLFGADVISRLGAADHDAPALAALAQASIYQAIGDLRLTRRVLARVERAVIVGNTAMHHLLLGYPVEQLGRMPFQPHDCAALPDAGQRFGALFPPGARVSLPPLIGGFVGSDTTACLAAFDFDHPPGPLLAIDLGTNGEVMATDGRSILVSSTAAGPAFEGVNISCGTRAVEGAIVDAAWDGQSLRLETVGGSAPRGITGSGLLSLTHALRQAGVLDDWGRLAGGRGSICVEEGPDEVEQAPLGEGVALTQLDVRELQKAKAAIRVAADLLLARLGLRPEDLQHVILTGSFGGQLNVSAALGVGLIPPVAPERVRLIPNGAGLGAALCLTDAGFARSQALAASARHVELDHEPEFNDRFVEQMILK